MLHDYNSGRMGKEANCDNCGNEDVMPIDDSLVSFDHFVSQKKRGGNTKMELDHYLEDDLMPRTSDFDILNWWKVNGPKYSILQRIAKDILAIPVSTVASESAFSTSGRLLSPHRSKLHAKTVEALMCAQNWLWAEIKGNLLIEILIYSFNDLYCICIFSNYLIKLILFVGTPSLEEEDMSIQNILDDYDDEDESWMEQSYDDS